MGTAQRKNENLAAGVACERLFARNGATHTPRQKTRLNAPQLIIPSFCVPFRRAIGTAVTPRQPREPSPAIFNNALI